MSTTDHPAIPEMTFKTSTPDLAGSIRQLVREQVEEHLQQLRDAELHGEAERLYAPSAPVVVTQDPALAPNQTELANKLADHLGYELSKALLCSTRRFLRQHGLSAGLYDHDIEAPLPAKAGHLDPCVVDLLLRTNLRDVASESICSLLLYPAKPDRLRLY